MLYVVLLHFLAGALTGSLYKVRTLLLLIGFVLFEALLLGSSHGMASGLLALANLMTIQVGYFFGIYARGIIEQPASSPSDSQSQRLH